MFAASLPQNSKLDLEVVVRAVFGVMREKINSGEIAKVSRQLPKDLQELWSA